MCLLFFDLRNNSPPNGYSLILISIRDEYFDRLTQACSIWSDNKNIIGGKFLLFFHVRHLNCVLLAFLITLMCLIYFLLNHFCLSDISQFK